MGKSVFFSEKIAGALGDLARFYDQGDRASYVTLVDQLSSAGTPMPQNMVNWSFYHGDEADTIESVGTSPKSLSPAFYIPVAHEPEISRPVASPSVLEEKAITPLVSNPIIGNTPEGALAESIYDSITGKDLPLRIKTRVYSRTNTDSSDCSVHIEYTVLDRDYKIHFGSDYTATEADDIGIQNAFDVLKPFFPDSRIDGDKIVIDSVPQKKR